MATSFTNEETSIRLKKETKGTNDSNNQTYPSSTGFFIPAEWEKHSGCWLGWPERTDNWRENAIPVQNAFKEVAEKISEFEPVTVCASSNQWENARKMLSKNIRVIEMSMNDAWFRDTGPIFVVKNISKGIREIASIDFGFNAWGGKSEGCYDEWSKDELIAQKISEIERIPIFEKRDMILEGGSIHVDGEGTLITTEECLLNQNRNKHLNKMEIENSLNKYLGIEKIIWIQNGFYGDDDTNGHVDNLVCFVQPSVVMLAWTDDHNDPQYTISKSAFEILSQSIDAKGRKLKIIKVHIPSPMYYTSNDISTLNVCNSNARMVGKRLTASYVNFYLPNGGVILPFFGDSKYDKLAFDLFKNVFPNRKVVPIHSSRDILLGGGNVHCITMQQPSLFA